MRLDGRGASAYTAMEDVPSGGGGGGAAEDDIDRDDALLHATDDFADLCLASEPRSRRTAVKKWIGELASNPSTPAVLFVLLLNQFLFSTMHTISHAALEYIPPIVFACFRFNFSLPFLAIIAHAERTSWRKLMGKDLEVTPRVAVWTMGCGLMGVAGAQMLVLLGNSLAGPSITAITQPGIPVYTALIAAMVGVERLSIAKISGVLLAVAGAVVLLHPWTMISEDEGGLEEAKGDLGSSKAIGTVVMLVQTLAYAVFMVMFSSFLQWFPHPFTAFFLCTLWSAIFQLVFCLPAFMTFSPADVPLSAWGAVAYCAICISFLAHTGQVWAIRHLRPTVPSLFVVLQPPLTIVMAVLFLGEKLELWTDLGGMGLILIGMIVVILAKNREAAPPGDELGGEKDEAAAPGLRATGTAGYAQLQDLREDGSGMEGGVSPQQQQQGLEWEEEDAGEKGEGDVEMSEVKGKKSMERAPGGMPLCDPFDTSMCLVSNLRASSLRHNSSISESLYSAQGSVRIRASEEEESLA